MACAPASCKRRIYPYVKLTRPVPRRSVFINALSECIGRAHQILRALLSHAQGRAQDSWENENHITMDPEHGMRAGELRAKDLSVHQINATCSEKITLIKAHFLSLLVGHTRSFARCSLTPKTVPSIRKTRLVIGLHFLLD